MGSQPENGDRQPNQPDFEKPENFLQPVIPLGALHDAYGDADGFPKEWTVGVGQRIETAQNLMEELSEFLKVEPTITSTHISDWKKHVDLTNQGCLANDVKFTEILERAAGSKGYQNALVRVSQGNAPQQEASLSIMSGEYSHPGRYSQDFDLVNFRVILPMSILEGSRDIVFTMKVSRVKGENSMYLDIKGRKIHFNDGEAKPNETFSLYCPNIPITEEQAHAFREALREYVKPFTDDNLVKG